jgi:hypothetical protein
MTGETAPHPDALGDTASPASPSGASTLADHWQTVATVALLGVDRRPVPEPPPGPIGELLGRRAHGDGAATVIDLAAALTVVRRAGVRPGPGLAMLVAPAPDPRAVCRRAALERIALVVDEWPELVDEWLTLVGRGGWRLPGDVAVALYLRFRGDANRRATIRALSGELTEWLGEVFPELAARGPRRPPARPEPVPVGRSTAIDPTMIPEGLESGELSVRHRAALIHAICSLEPERLNVLAERLSRAGTNPNTMGLALSLADLAHTRHAMITELT